MGFLKTVKGGRKMALVMLGTRIVSLNSRRQKGGMMVFFTVIPEII